MFKNVPMFTFQTYIFNSWIAQFFIVNFNKANPEIHDENMGTNLIWSIYSNLIVQESLLHVLNYCDWGRVESNDSYGKLCTNMT